MADRHIWRVRECQVCHDVKRMDQAVCSACRTRKMRAEKREQLAAPAYHYANLHEGGEYNCGCELCYLVRQPLIAFQIGWLAQAVAN